jgi:arginine:pyruvate transaminase
MFVMVNVAALGMNGDEFAQRLLDEVLVTVVPGSAFGPSAVDFVRVTLCQPMDVLARAMDRIEGMLRAPAGGVAASR